MDENKRNPIFSGIFSLLVPGLGQLYNGQMKKSIVIYSLWLFPTILIMPLFDLQYTFIGILIFAIISTIIYIFAFIDAIIISTRLKNYSLQNFNRWYIYILIILSATAISFLFDEESYLGINSFSFPTSSMEPTILNGDYLMVDLEYYENKDPKPSDIIIFDYPKQPELSYLKRCIAISGQVVEIKDKVVLVDEIKFPDDSLVQFKDPKIYKKDEGTNFFPIYNNLGSRDCFGPIKIPEGKYFVLGDNRDNSSDSRYWGFVPRENIYGKAMFLYFSWDKKADSIFDKIRWSRIGKEIH